jgi:PKHD-type hydroxylase
MFEFSYWKWDKQLDKEFCNSLLTQIKWEEAKTAGINQDQVNKEIRKTDIVWVSAMSPIGCISEVYAQVANDAAGWNFAVLPPVKEQVQIARYSVGSFYDWHTDSYFSKNKIQRKLSISIQLNDSSEFAGGQLEFIDSEEQPVMEQGSIIVFPSTIKHRVTPVTEGTRYSAVTWINGPPFK